MKSFIFTFFLIVFLLSFVFPAFSSAVTAQEPGMPPPSAADQNDKRGEPLFRQLNLSPEQIEQIRVINRETREQMRGVVQKQRDARRALDAAIYADNSSSAEVEQRAREFAEAQAAVSKLRARTEFRIRQILSAEQLARFRVLRRRAIEQAPQQQQQPGFGAPRQNRPRRLPLKNRPPF
jgi:Spy/CpxP family protein refolding chaperone